MFESSSALWVFCRRVSWNQCPWSAFQSSVAVIVKDVIKPHLLFVLCLELLAEFGLSGLEVSFLGGKLGTLLFVVLTNLSLNFASSLFLYHQLAA